MPPRRVARPGGRAGGGGSARHPGEPQSPTGGPPVSSTISEQTGRALALEQIHVPENVRALDAAHVQALAGSIALQGLLVPLVVRHNGGDAFELVAGFHRFAAARSL